MRLSFDKGAPERVFNRCTSAMNIRRYPTVAVGLLFCCATIPVTAEDVGAIPLEAYGVWDRGASFSFTEYPFLKGLSYGADWEEIEPQPDVFDWSSLDAAVQRAHEHDKFMYISINPGPDSPQWVYELGVPKVSTDDEKHLGKWKHYPYYLAPEYKRRFFGMIRSLAEHLDRLPAEQHRRIAFIQVKTGCTGDECPYKGQTLDPKYEIRKDSPEWRDFRLETFALFVDLFQSNRDRRIELLFNAVGGNDDDGEDAAYGPEWDWITSHVKGAFGIKNGALSRGHHLRGERVLYEQWIGYLVNPKGLRLFRRSEMDQTWKRPWYQRNLPMNFYWGAVNAVHGGQSIWDVTASALEASKDENIVPAFEFFNKYAGQIYPATATDAFCALHKGLDASDTAAYPEDIFGKASPNNVERMAAICQAFAEYGARIDDADALRFGQVRQRSSQKGFNDVGWEIWPDNYTRFLYQIEADSTSVPHWRIGGEITRESPVYARFARGFEHASGRDALYFKLDDEFFTGRELKPVTIRIVWYDQHPGSTWKLLYDAGSGEMKTGYDAEGRSDCQWRTETIQLSDAVMDHGGDRGSDVALVNIDDKDDLFSLIELHRD
ncbi:MAG TPA: beta-galactosidase [Thermoguttaceae bacterium]|nr:beta-galactosidase [Thermoguttaceae bacterium]